MKLVNKVLPQLLITVSVVVSVPTSLTTLTLYTTQKTWNEARFICEARGGHLLFIKTQERKAELELLLGHLPWNETMPDSVHMGLYNNAGTDPGVYTWSDCDPLGSWEDWRGSYEPVFESTKRCSQWYTKTSSSGWGSSSTGPGWKSTTCSDNDEYVCENLGGACSYDIVEDQRGIDSTPFDMGSMPASQCQEICNTAVEDGMECWAVTWSSTACQLHFTTNSTFYADPINTITSPGDSLYRKMCTVALVDVRDFPDVSLDSTTPFSSCPGAAGTGDAIVYTLVHSNLTWSEARSVCGQSDQTLLVLDDAQEGLQVHQLYGGYDITFWMGLSGNTTNGFYWLNDIPVNWNSYAPGHPVAGSYTTCAANTPETNTWTTHDCEDRRSFVCKKTGNCVFAKQSKTKGIGGDDNGFKSASACETLCNEDPECVGFSHRALIYSCILHISTDPDYLNDPANSETNNYYSLYVRACVIGLVIDATPLLLDELQAVNVTDITLSSSLDVSTLMTSFPAHQETTVASLDTMFESSFTFLQQSTAVYSTYFENTIDEITSFTDFSFSTEPSIVSTGYMILSSQSQSSEDNIVSTGLYSLESSEYALFPSVESDLIASFVLSETSLWTPTYFEYTIDETTTFPDFSYLTDPSIVSTEYMTLSSPSQASEDYIVNTGLYSSESSGYALFSSDESDLTSPFVSSETTYETSLVTHELTMSEISTLAVSDAVYVVSSQTYTSLSSILDTQTYDLSSVTSSVTSQDASVTSATTLLSVAVNYCPCKCHVTLTSNETATIVMKIKKKLLIEKKVLSSEVNKKTSAKDDRLSSRNMGYIAIIFLSLLGMCMLLSDVTVVLGPCARPKVAHMR